MHTRLRNINTRDRTVDEFRSGGVELVRREESHQLAHFHITDVPILELKKREAIRDEEWLHHRRHAELEELVDVHA